MMTAPRPPSLHSPHPPAPPTKNPGVYGSHFWLSYAGNLLVMTAVAVLFRYADFVAFLGGTEFHLGWIVGVGMVGSCQAPECLANSRRHTRHRFPDCATTDASSHHHRRRRNV